MTDATIRIESVRRTYGQGASAVEAVKGVNLEIAAGSFVAIVGASGSGKSTLLNMVGTLDRPTEGRVRVGDVDLYALDDNALTRFRRDRIGFVFQFFHLLPMLSALENAMLPLELAGRGGREARARALGLLERMGLSARAEHRPDELSGGEMQRVAIARALIMDPPLLLADEPTGNLDSKTGKSILELLKELADGKRTILLVTHDPAVAAAGDRVITMADGLVQSDVATGADRG
ncbi:MAG: ABC transporter ATP-binding protein [Myxococcales bacterium]|nr:ABC transporter ATP-binding protein [Myxococcales bacterium]